MIGGTAWSRLEPQVYSETVALPGVAPAAGENHTRGASYEVVKRVTDVAGALILLLASAPLLAVIALAVKLTSDGPMLFTQRRIGRGGRVFRCYKFRTMIPDAETRLIADPELTNEFDTNFKIKNDPRVTPVGAFLRRTSLDELPQLWNVLRGDMTLIGPRPIIEPELRKYGHFAGRLLAVKPGLGGLWQVSGRSDTTYDERIAMDMNYIDSRSTLVDLSLLVQTALVVLKGRGAY
jgi:lipopolysaccharide/colanic/teichoic acid biosynthesis glycosyltransferase